MRFLLFNLAVVAALFYLFSADHSGPNLSNDHRDDPLQAIRQKLESLARDVADGRRSADQAATQSVAAGIAKDVAQAPQPQVADVAPGEPENQPIPSASTQVETVTAGQDVARVEAKVPQSLDDGPQQGPAVADPIGPLPQVDDPAVVQRRIEVLDGVAPLDDGLAETPVEAGPPMGPEERLRKLYSLAEEMELLYVRKMTR